MSNHRVSPEAGWVSSTSRLPKGPNGRALCRQCGEEVPKGRRTFCGDECIARWRIKTDPGYVRTLVFKRDKGVCAKCGRDTEEWRKQLNSLHYWEQRKAEEALGIGHRYHLWDADHIIPVAEGGGECDLDNYRTLCVPCHREETAALRARLKEARRQQQPHTMELGLGECRGAATNSESERASWAKRQP